MEVEEECNSKLQDINDKIFSDVRASITFIRNSENTPLFYLACPNETCNRKVVEDGEEYRCEKCNQSFAQPVARYILTAKIMDDSHSFWV